MEGGGGVERLLNRRIALFAHRWLARLLKAIVLLILAQRGDDALAGLQQVVGRIIERSVDLQNGDKVLKLFLEDRDRR